MIGPDTRSFARESEGRGARLTPAVRAHATAVGAAVVGIAIVLALFGVAARELALYALYWLAFILVPGAALTWALERVRPSLIRAVAVGSAVGYTLECLAFAAATAAGRQSTFYAYPAIAIVVALVLALLRPRAPRAQPSERSDGRASWVVAAVAVLAVVLVAGEYFHITPLPRQVSSGAAYNGDTVYLLSLAAEAKHHFPLSEPTVSGTPLFYHPFSLIDMAAASTTTGIDLSVVGFRLVFGVLLGLLVLQIAWLSRSRGNSWLRAGGAAAFVLLIGELDLTPRLDFPFDDIFYTLLWFGPGIGSLIVFVPAAALCGELLDRRRPIDPGSLVLLAVLFAGLAGTKGGSVLPVVGVAAGLMALWRLRTERSPDVRSLGIGGASVLALAVATAAEYHGATRDLVVTPLRTFERMPAMAALRPDLAWLPSPLWAVFAAALGSLGLLGARLVPLASALRDRSRRSGPATGWYVALSAASLVPLFVFDHPGLSHLHSLAYGRITAGVLAVEGIRRPPAVKRTWAAAAAAGIALVVAGAWPLSHVLTDDAMYRLQYVVIAVVVVGAAVVAGRRSLSTAAAALLLVAALNVPFDALAAPIYRGLNGGVGPSSGRLLTPGLVQALHWIRAHSGPDDVLAVNNQTVYSDGSGPFDFYYSAFSERRVFLEGWANAERALELGYERVATGLVQPFPERLALNNAVFRRGSRRALDVLVRRYGVRYLLVDEQAGRVAPNLPRAASIVFRAPGAVVLRPLAAGRRTTSR